MKNTDRLLYKIIKWAKNRVERIKYHIRRIELEHDLELYSNTDREKWYETFVEWCAHTDSSAWIYNSYVKEPPFTE
jgi:23S rRNA G2445 N2-methylase RlmL